MKIRNGLVLLLITLTSISCSNVSKEKPGSQPSLGRHVRHDTANTRSSVKRHTRGEKSSQKRHARGAKPSEKRHGRHISKSSENHHTRYVTQKFSQKEYSRHVPIHAERPRNFQEELVYLHNQLRARHRAPPLVWDNQLAQYAAYHAKNCKFRHSYGPYGENLAAGYSIQRAVSEWYGEKKYYSYRSPGFSHTTGHFTQIVWKSSQKIGCAYVACHGKQGTPGNYLVCEYSPVGNIVNEGYFTENVLPEKQMA